MPWPILILFLSFCAENMQINCEASLKCLQGKGFPCNFQCNGSSMAGFTELKNEPGTHPAGDVTENSRRLGSEFLEASNEFCSKPTYHHDFNTWTACHFNSQKVQQYQMNAFESHFYPYPVDNQFQYVPMNMVAQGYPHEQYQEFQYFVVIDFEATCDRDKNPHPQEIIEFPSVIVSSVTGQLEACFQTYVRPTCNQLLSDFCKDLTGIQQIQVCQGKISPFLTRRKGYKNSRTNHYIPFSYDLFYSSFCCCYWADNYFALCISNILVSIILVNGNSLGSSQRNFYRAARPSHWPVISETVSKKQVFHEGEVIWWFEFSNFLFDSNSDKFMLYLGYISSMVGMVCTIQFQSNVDNI